jgi:hypothetical protein
MPGDEPRYGEPLGSKYWRRTEDAKDFLKNEIKNKNNKTRLSLITKAKKG